MVPYITARAPGRSLASLSRWEGQHRQAFVADFSIQAVLPARFSLSMIGINVDIGKLLSFSFAGRGFIHRFEAGL